MLYEVITIIKLCDRLHNMRTLHFRSDAKRRDTALETMYIYAPIAHRLGIRAVKEEIEDIAFHYLDPFACRITSYNVCYTKLLRNCCCK